MILTTKYFGPTYAKGSRIRVRAGARRAKFYPYDHASNNPHLAAVHLWMAGNNHPLSLYQVDCYALPDACDDAFVFVISVRTPEDTR